MTLVLATTCAVTSSNIYLVQPMLAQIETDLGASASAVGLVASSTQIGYALGILLLVPLGDIRDRRPLILTLMLATMVALIAAAAAPNVGWLGAAGFLVGLFTPIPQIVMPMAVMLSGGASRGQTVGTLQAGLLIGLLASRAYAGALAEWVGWRAVYGCSVLLMAIMLAVLVRALPSVAPSGSAPSYPALLGSLFTLVRENRDVSAVCVSGALVGVAFGAFWNTLAFELHASFELGPTVIGLFGLVAAASATASPIAGRFADTHGPRITQTILIGVLVLGWIALVGAPNWIALAVLGTILLDIGVWGNQVVNQSTLFGLDEANHSRLNTLYFFARFAGISTGSAIGAALWTHSGWTSVVVFGIGSALVALPVFFAHRASRGSPDAVGAGRLADRG